ncbi:hypothetical protein ETD83_06875 [Actinomadura soli]|uniref:DUF3551 domain-containing protein n=1 Tax=Actinomadura soli TaxID=2508997 RepID=A0A5C4JH98_9ACTN|nr:hypothetical protein [Actinomadura soli]TMR05417.1 hypothetical protein ETD83_06875 [Actinomadura soli]
MTGALIVAVLGIGGGVGGAAAASSSSDQNTRQDCRTYSGVTQCGEQRLDEKQRACVTTAVQQGMTERRAEVECRAFG